MSVHQLSVVDPQAHIDPTATIGPFCMVGPEAKIGPEVELVSHVTVIGDTTIGRGTKCFPGSVLGGDPQDLKFHGEASRVTIGERCRIHECATVNKGTAGGGMLTSIDDETLIMAYAHVAHDCHIGKNCVIGNNSQLAGHCKIADRVIISGLVGMHHFVTVGEMGFVAAMSGVRHDAPPFCIVEGYPAEARSVNVVGLRRAGWTDEEISAMRAAFRHLFHHKTLSRAEALAELRENDDLTPGVTQLCDWLENHLNNTVKGRVQEAQR
jgi:UDP-N-acetylglucosamine acyltransferase